MKKKKHATKVPSKRVKALSRTESGRGKRRKVKFGLAIFEDGRHHFRRDWRQQDAVAEVASSGVAARRLGGSENGQSVRSSGAQSRPVFENSGIAQGGNQSKSSVVEPLHGCGVGLFVESGLLNRSASQQTPVAAWDQINVGRADHVLHQFSGLHRKAEHLSFYRPCGQVVRRNC